MGSLTTRDSKKSEARTSHTLQAGKGEIGSPGSSLIACIVSVRHTIGNRAVQRLMKRSSGLFRAKLTISQPNDIYEHEADRVADEDANIKVLYYRSRPRGKQ